MPDAWIERVRQADADAEAAWKHATIQHKGDFHPLSTALFAIAAELRAQRIARRPGAGQ